MRKYDVAISFAGEDRQVAEALASSLRAERLKVFYDKYAQAELWGKDLYAHLSKVYKDDAEYCLMLLSAHYSKKQWTNHERKAAQARAFQENREYILPLKLDDTQIDGVLSTTGYMDYRTTPFDEIIGAVVEKLREFRQPSEIAVSGDNGMDYWHDDTADLKKWIGNLEAQYKEAKTEADYAQANGNSLAGAYHAANKKASALKAEMDHLTEIMKRVDAGFPYFESYGFEAAVDACGEVAVWEDFQAIAGKLSAGRPADPTIRIPIETQTAYVSAVNSRLFDDFKLCMCFEPPDDPLRAEVIGPIDYFLFGTITAIHTEKKRQAHFLISTWRSSTE